MKIITLTRKIEGANISSEVIYPTYISIQTKLTGRGFYATAVFPKNSNTLGKKAILLINTNESDIAGLTTEPTTVSNSANWQIVDSVAIVSNDSTTDKAVFDVDEDVVKCGLAIYCVKTDLTPGSEIII